MDTRSAGVLVGQSKTKVFKRCGTRQESITAVECVSASGRALPLLIISKWKGYGGGGLAPRGRRCGQMVMDYLGEGLNQSSSWLPMVGRAFQALVSPHRHQPASATHSSWAWQPCERRNPSPQHASCEGRHDLAPPLVTYPSTAYCRNISTS